MDPKQIRELLQSIPVVTPKGEPDVIGLRDRAVIATLVYTAARAGAVAKLERQGFYSEGRQHYLRLDEKGGKERTIPCRTDLQDDIEECLAAVGPGETGSAPFRSMVRRTGRPSSRRMTDNDIGRMFQRRLAAADLATQVLRCHSLRASTAPKLAPTGRRARRRAVPARARRPADDQALRPTPAGGNAEHCGEAFDLSGGGSKSRRRAGVFTMSISPETKAAGGNAILALIPRHKSTARSHYLVPRSRSWAARPDPSASGSRCLEPDLIPLHLDCSL